MAIALASIIALLLLSGTADAQLSAHGLVYEKNPGTASPAMISFFGSRPKVALPEALNIADKDTTAALASPTRRRPESKESHRPIAGVVAAGVVGGVLGFALIVAGVVVAVVHMRRRTGSDVGPGSVLDLVRARSGSEVRLGSV